jgi:hypothetical protein
MMFHSFYKSFGSKKFLFLFGIVLAVGAFFIGGVSAETTFAPLLPGDLLINPGGNGPSSDLLFNGEEYLSLWSNNSGVHGQFIGETGILSGSSFHIPDVAASSPKIAFNGDKYLVVWFNNDGIMGSIISHDGVPGPKFTICNEWNTQSYPCVMSDGTNFLVLWMDARNYSTNYYDIYGRTVSSSGQFIGSEFIVGPTQGTQEFPIGAYNGENYFVFYAQAPVINSPNPDISLCRVTPGGVILDPTGIEVCTAQGSQSTYMNADCAVGADGTTLITWIDRRDGSSHPKLFASRLSKEGTLIDGPAVSSGILIFDNYPYGPDCPSVVFNGDDYVFLFGSYGTVFASLMSPDGSIHPIQNVPLTIRRNDVYGRVNSAFDGTNYLITWNDFYWKNASGQMVSYSNQVPIANAGSDGSLQAIRGTGNLNGSGSYDPDENYPLTYYWSLVTKPANSYPNLFNTSSKNATFQTSTPGEYTFELKVTDKFGAVSQPDQVTYLVTPYTNQAPVLNPIGSQSITEQQTLTLLLTGNDPDGDPVEFGVSYAPAGSNFYTTNNTFIWRPSITQSGTYNVRFWIRDSSQTYTTENVLITVQDLNQAPVLNPIGDRSVEENQTLTILLSSTDPDGDAVAYSMSPVLQGAILTGSTFSWKPTFNQAGVYQVNFKVTDTKGAVDNESITVTVIDVNQPPIVSPISDKTVLEGDTLTFEIVANDPEGQVLTYLSNNLPIGATLTGMTFSWTPNFTQSGNYPIIFTITDSAGATTVVKVAITVVNVNQPPVLAYIGSKTVNEEQPLNFTISATDGDNTPLTYSAAGLPNGATFDPISGQFLWRPSYEQSGVYSLIFSVSDGLLSDVEQITITVNDVDPYRWNSIGPASGDIRSIAISPNYAADTTIAGGTDQPGNFVKTVNNGVDWILVNPYGSVSTKFFDGIAFSPGYQTDQTVYLPGANGGGLFRSTDGGTTWERKIDSTPSWDVAFSTPTTVYVATDVGIYKSTDSGNSFTQLTTGGAPTSQCQAVTVASDGTVYAGSRNYGIFKSVNNGLTWVQVNNGLPVGSGGAVSDVMVAPDQTVFSMVNYNGIYRSKDQGTSWTKVNSEPYNSMHQSLAISPDYIADKTLFASYLAYGGTWSGVAMSQDGGDNWVRIDRTGLPGASEPVIAVSPAFASDRTIFAGTENGISNIKVKHVPILTQTDNQMVNEGQLLSFTISAIDGDIGDTLTYSGTGLPTGSSFDASTRTFSWTPTYNQAGTYPVTFTVSDGMWTDTEVITITVSNINRAPVLDLIGAKSTDENKLLSFTVSASDPDGDILNYTAENLPAGATFSGTTFSWIPGFDQGKDIPYNVTFSVTDDSFTVSEVVVITVHNLNQPPLPPSVSGTGLSGSSTTGYTASVNEGNAITFTVATADPDTGDSISWATTSLPTGATFNNGIFSWTPDFVQAGSYPITFTATDSLGATSSVTVTITVSNVNQPPELPTVTGTGLSGSSTTGYTASVNEGTAITFAVATADPDTGDSISWATSSLPTGATFNNGIFSWTPDFAQAGSYPITFTATDTSGATSGVTVTITVSNVNQPPALPTVTGTGLSGSSTSGYSTSVSEGSGITFTISTTDPDTGDAISWTTTTLPTGATFTNSVFSWTPDFVQAGSHPITFTVTDTSGATSSVMVTIIVDNVNQDPVLDAIGAKSVEEGVNLEFTIDAGDPDGDALTYAADNLPAGASFDLGTKTFSWIPTFSQAGIYQITFTTTDGSLTDSEIVTINVNNVNQPPTLPTVSGTGLSGSSTTGYIASVNEGTAITFTVATADPDTGDSISWTTSSLPTGATFNNGIFSWTPDFSQAASYPITFTATDTSGATSSVMVTIIVDNANRAPELAVIENKTVPAGTELTFTVSAIDADGDSLTYSASGLQDGAGINPTTGMFTWTPGSNQFGEYPITFTVSDGKLTDSESMTITVNKVIPENRAPELAVIEKKTVTAGTELTFTVSATDADGDSLTYSASGLQDGAGINPITGVFTWTPGQDQFGEYPITFTVSDGKLTDSESMTITVNKVIPENRAPELAVIENKTVTAGTELTFTVSATDADGDQLTYSASGIPTNATFSSKTFTWTPSMNQIGTYTVVFTVSDGKLSDSESIKITVTDVINPNHPPVLSLIGNKTVNATELLSFSISAVDPESKPLTYSISVLPTGGSFTGTTFTWTPSFSQIGTYPVTFTVSDGELTDSEEITITVNNTIAPNHAPVLSPIANIAVNAGELVTITLSATDPDGNTLTYSATNLPTGSIFSGKTFTWTPSQPGAFKVLFSVSDGSLTDSKEITITVNSVNTPPTITAIEFPADPYQKGTTVSVTGSFTDPDTADTHTAQWNWGDGTSSTGIVTKSGNTGSVTGSHIFNNPGIYTVSLIVTDSKSASTTASATDFIVIYDPEGQFVTGGGGYTSFAGLYIPEPTLSGKTSYGFNAKYKKGTMIPEGNTEFKLQVGKTDKVNFKATSYDWLVISGAKATFQGSGTIDKQGNYWFLISCIDGKLAGTDDKIRMKIYNKATNAVIYDNQPGAGINDAPTMKTEEGNIAIHK